MDNRPYIFNEIKIFDVKSNEWNIYQYARPANSADI